MVFVDSPTDMAMAQVVPIFDWYEDMFAPVETQHAMAERYPDRVLFCGGVDPLYPSVEGALEELDRQVLGARRGLDQVLQRPRRGCWRCDDESWPIRSISDASTSAFDVLQFHKGIPFGLMDVER